MTWLALSDSLFAALSQQRPSIPAFGRADLMMMFAELIRVAFAAAFGACIGSLVNVLVYRLPLGLDVVRPTSRCPSCGTLLTWRENIPIFGWLFLGGRCRFCRARISAEYPIVEAFVAVLFAVTFLVLYADGGRWLGINWGWARPEWAEVGWGRTWPLYVMLVVLFSCLTAATLVDARTATIPIQLTTVPLIVAVVVHLGWALYVQFTGGRLPITAPGWNWSLATPGGAGWWWVGAALGGAAGLVLSNVLMHLGVIRRSFADYEEWEKAALAEFDEQKKHQAGADGQAPQPEAPQGADRAEMWIQYPHARREMVRELIFLSPCIGLAMIGGWLAHKLAGPWKFQPAAFEVMPAVAVPLWLDVLAGVLLGAMIGGGIVWAVRILGSLGFGKEAMGLGDVHLMAAVGACLGWVDAIAGFFGAAFLGLLWAVVGRVVGGAFSRTLPYGPFLAAATVLVWFFKPLLERALSVMVGASPPINLP